MDARENSWARALLSGLGFFALIWTAPLSATPLTSDKTRTVEARWIKTTAKRCDAVCAAHGAEAENMLVWASDGGDIYLCRVRKPPSNRFGNNYADICKVEDSDAPSGTTLESVYECLCVWRTR